MRPRLLLTFAILTYQLFMLTVSGQDEDPWLRCFKDRDCRFGECQNGFYGKCDNVGLKATNTCSCLNTSNESNEAGKYVKYGYAKNCRHYPDGSCQQKCSRSNEYVGYVCNIPDPLPGPPPTPPIYRCLCLLKT